MARDETAVMGFEGDPHDAGPLARLIESAPSGAFVEIGKRVENGVARLTMKRHVPGRGSIATAPVSLRAAGGETLDVRTALALLAVDLEARERRAGSDGGRLRIA
jgi:hypothetical protein